MDEELSVVGKRLPRWDAAPKATGTARYAADMKLPGMLIGKVLRSPHPHARVIKIDKSKAEKLPGVEAVITYEDVPKKLCNMSDLEPLVVNPAAKGFKADALILTDKARHIGDAIAAVAAINEGIAEEALELIKVKYEKLPAVFDLIEAMKPGAPRIHDNAKDNIAWHQVFPVPVGDVEKGFKEADYILEETFRTSKQIHCQLEPSACVASFDSNKKLTIWSPTQAAFIFRRKIAEMFDLPVGRVRWITPYVGGSFGNGTSFRAEPICVALAKKTGKPVKLEYTREEQFVASETRHAMVHSGKLGVKKDGTITAIRLNLISDAGAYVSQSNGPTNSSMRNFLWLYRCPNTAGEADIVYTNTPAAGACRGFGNPQAMWALEQMIDMAAQKIGMDPLEFRLKNHRRTGDPSYIPQHLIESCALGECIKRGAERIGWKQKRGGKKGEVRRRGVGMAIMFHVSGGYPVLLEHTSVFIKLNEDGSANLSVNVCDMGQGILAALAQIAAEELGLRAEDIHIVAVDTDTNLFDVGQRASRTCYVAGNAVQQAAADAKRQLIERAAKKLEVPADDLELRNGRVYVKAEDVPGLTVAELARGAIYNFKGECCDIIGKSSFEPKSNPNPFQAAFAEVEVDTQTGEVTVLKIVVAHDIGRAINPITVEGQLDGAIVQAMGYGMTEDFVINKKTGLVESDNFTTYKILSTLDLPETETILVEQPTPSGPFGAKSVGESGLNAVAPAIANAMYDAVGIRIKDLPITPEKVLNALKGKP